jgi:tRNA (mo5U34)-methyltransferase
VIEEVIETGTNPDEALRERIVELGPWFHQITLGEGIRTREIAPAPGPESTNNPHRRWLDLEAALPPDISGRRVLDVGCLDGYFSVRLAKRGVSEVVAMDVWGEAIARLLLVKETLSLDQVMPLHGDVYDLDPDRHGRFDLVVMIDVLFAIDHPLLALERIAAVTDCLYVSTTVIRGTSQRYMELRTSTGEHGTYSRYWIPTEACLITMLEAVGFDNLKPAPTVDPHHLIYRAIRTPVD